MAKNFLDYLSLFQKAGAADNCLGGRGEFTFIYKNQENPDNA